jgi:siroheme decarboxylase
MNYSHADYKISAIDRTLLNIVQNDFPIEARPYKKIGEMLALQEQEVISRLQGLRTEGIIRRIGGIFDSKNLGFFSTLIALQVSKEEIQKVAAVINEYPGVTHNYERQHELNIWFTLIAATEKEIQDALNNVAKLPGVEKIFNLPALKVFKIGTNFQLTGESNEA